MKDLFVRSTLFLAMLFLSTSLAFATEQNMKVSDPAGSIKTATKPAIDAPNVKAAAKNKLVDINTASETELKSIPGIGTAYASKIISGRPYTNKGQLKSRNILPVPVYEQVKDLIVARQPVKQAPEKGK